MSYIKLLQNQQVIEENSFYLSRDPFITFLNVRNIEKLK